MATPTLTIRVGGLPLIELVDVPRHAVPMLRDRFDAAPVPHQRPSVVVRFGGAPPARSTVVLSSAGVRVAADDSARFSLLDGAGRQAQLPVVSHDTVLAVDPEIDAAHGATLHQLVERLLEWQMAQGGMVALKGAAAVVGGLGVALVGYGGSGKSSVLLELLRDADAYVTEERLVLTAPRTLAAWPGPVRLSLARRYTLASDLEASLPARARIALRATALVQRAGAPLRPAQRLLHDRWIAVDPTRVFPKLTRPDRAPLDALVFLLPTTGGVLRVESVPHREVVARVAHHVTYLRDVSLFALRALFACALPAHTPWPLDVPTATLHDRLPALLDGVSGFTALIPTGTPAARVAAAVTERLR